jgi:dihydrofolate reductase/thymidylate synthase
MIRRFNLIFATDLNGLFGWNQKLPWHIKEDLAHFNRTTRDTFNKNICVMGYYTNLSLPAKLDGRVNVVLSKKEKLDNDKYDEKYTDLDSFIYNSNKYNPNQKIFIIGGKNIIETCLKEYTNLIDTIYHTEIQHKFNHEDGNIYLNIDVLKKYEKYRETVVHKNFDYYINFNKYVLPKHEEFQYLELLNESINKGELRTTRNANTYSLFNKAMTFDLTKGFPLFTTKKVHLRGIFEELMFFIRGQTDSKILENKGIYIWKPNTTKDFISKVGLDYREGDMGPMYGFQWRHFNSFYMGCDHDYTNYGFDQLEYCLDLLLNDPHSRRILMTTYNPAQAKMGVLYPCHSIVIQFYVNEIDSNKYISMNLYIRSNDFAVGNPYNVASNALLLHLVCNTLNARCGESKYIPFKLNVLIGDLHVYQQHLDGVVKQINRMPYDFPKINIKKGLEKIEEYKWEDIELENYTTHDPIKYLMIA